MAASAASSVAASFLADAGEEELAIAEEVLESVRETEGVDRADGDTNAGDTDDKDETSVAQWLDLAAALRCVRARPGSKAKAIAMLVATVRWRREARPHAITLNDVRDVLAVGGLFLTGARDKAGRPCVTIRPGETNPYSADERVRFLVYVVECAVAQADRAQEGDGKVTWIADFSSYGQRARSPDGRVVAQQSLHVLQNHYPERLGAMFIVSAPWIFRMLGTFLSPFMESETKKKIHWLSGTETENYAKLKDFIDEDQIEERYGGHYRFELDPTSSDPFSPARESSGEQSGEREAAPNTSSDDSESGSSSEKERQRKQRRRRRRRRAEGRKNEEEGSG
jgi:CRAL/TRIO domain